jgi:hypothetical protein
MRKRTTVMLLAAILMIWPPTTQPAAALPSHQIEILYFNYGSQYFDGQEMVITCGGYSWTWGDTTPNNGGLKVEITTDCDTYETTYVWYRWKDIGGTCFPGYWIWIPEPYYQQDPEVC